MVCPGLRTDIYKRLDTKMTLPLIDGSPYRWVIHMRRIGYIGLTDCLSGILILYRVLCRICEYNTQVYVPYVLKNLLESDQFKRLKADFQ